MDLMDVQAGGQDFTVSLKVLSNYPLPCAVQSRVRGCALLRARLQGCVCGGAVYEGCTGGKGGPSVLLNPG